MKKLLVYLVPFCLSGFASQAQDAYRESRLENSRGTNSAMPEPQLNMLTRDAEEQYILVNGYPQASREWFRNLDLFPLEKKVHLQADEQLIKRPQLRIYKFDARRPLPKS